ncbi:hypothetical protein HYH02_001886 [Chlamydomonas schloesseri]|uniref:Protein kinase domain-containing protein n=1 Tax=Chlamydomonas schloesseri TaxID=2026947 RepID=A0A835WT15_9CHLO|nr:hypothetical protein HYH02_001886 [Chlamydomonas schloesseri]|eukprot:KAG2453673.1 hypothetical protein HYH02_001886 [Chlamydomonas schloesseri]
MSASERDVCGRAMRVRTDALASGSLQLTAEAVWDFEGRPGVLTARPGTAVALSCLTALNATVAPPSAAAGSVFLQPTALDLSAASGLSMSGVSLSTDCGTVLAYQQYLCMSLRAAGSLTMDAGVIRFARWRDGFTSLDNVTLTCASSASSAAAAAAAAVPCRLVSVQTASELLEAFTVHAAAAAAAAANLTVIVAANLSISNRTWPTDAPVPVLTNVTLTGSALLTRPVLDLGQLTDAWSLGPAVGVWLHQLSIVNLSPMYFSPGYVFSQFGMLSERVWAFQRFDRQVHISNVTLVVPAVELTYTRYWLTWLVSPDPEANAKASWLRVIDIHVLAVNSTGVYYDRSATFTTSYANVRLTSTLGDNYPLLEPAPTVLRQLLADRTPLTAVSPVGNSSDFLLALDPSNSVPDDAGQRWIFFIANMSLADAGVWPAAGVTVPGSNVIDAWPLSQPVEIGLGAQAGALVVPSGAMLTLRGVVLSQLAPRSNASVWSSADPLAVLSSPLWGVSLAAGAAKARLENCTLVVSAEELRLLQQALGGSSAAALTGLPFNPGLVSAVQVFFTAVELRQAPGAPQHLMLVSGSTERYTLLNVTVRQATAADGVGAVAADLAAVSGIYAESTAGGSGSSGPAGWEVGVIVGCVAGGVLLLAAVAAFLWARRKRQAGSRDAATGPQGAYEKYLRGSGGRGSRPPVASDPESGAQPSQEQLTNSSQVLRPGARQSDLEAAMAAAGVTAGVKGSGADTTSGVGMAGRSSASNTGITATHSSSQGVSGGPSGSIVPSLPDHHRALAQPGGHAAVLPPRGPSQGTDSFNQPPSASGLGHHGPAAYGPAAASASARSSTPSMGLQASGGGAFMAMAKANDVGLPQTRTPGAPIDQMHALIASFGRDLNDKQLVVHGLIGKGAHGTVYRGTWRGLPVAVKSMVFGPDGHARHQQRALMEAAISSNLVHPNIVTTYSYELREVQHELASLSPELSQQGGGWRLLIIQEFCDAGPLRRLVDCGFFLTPPSHTNASHSPAPSLAQLTPLDTSSRQGDDNPSSIKALDAASTAPSSAVQVTPSAKEQAAVDPSTDAAGAQHPAHARPLLEDVPADVGGGRPASSLQAALRYVEAALQIARGLQHIHDKNIVHGDLNPNNVLLVRAPGNSLGFCLKVSDFGLSVRMAEDESHLSNLFQGTPYYCAPEVMLSGKIGKSSDLYSLGIMLWELQNGTRPPWRMGVRLRTYPSLNTGELDFGPDTPPRYARLACDADALASGSLQLTAEAVWDFEGRPGVLIARPGTAVALSCLTAFNATVAPPSAAAGSVFLQPTALDLSAASGLSMSGVSLSTDCGTVLAYQQYLCTSLRAAGSLTMDAGVIRFARWRDGFTSLDNVTLTCASSAGVAAAAPAAVPCRLVSVQTASELLEAFTVHAAAAAAAAANLTVIVAANLSISNRTWPTDAPVPVLTNVTLTGSALLTRPVLDLGQLTDVWSLGPTVAVLLANITLYNLTPTYYSPGYVFSQFGMLSERVWAFRRFGQQIYIRDATLVVPADELAYTRYWLTWLVSPDPEANAKASWLKVVDIRVTAVNSTGVYYERAVTFTAIYANVRLTSTLGDDYPLLTPAPSALRQLLADRTPLTAVNPVVNTSDLLLALVPSNSVPDDAGRRWIFFIANMSLADAGVWPAAGVTVPGSNVLGVGPVTQAVTIGLGAQAGALVVPSGATLTLRGVVLSQLAPRSNASVWSSADPLAVLSSPLWGVSLAAGATKARLENCTLVVSAEELRLLQQALGGSSAAALTGLPFNPGLVSAVQVFFTAVELRQAPGASQHLMLVSGSTERYTLLNVTVRQATAADGVGAVAADLAAVSGIYAESTAGGSGSSGPAGWEVGVIVGCVVGGVLLLAAVAAFLWARRKRQAGSRDAATGPQGAYEKYLRGSGGRGSRPPVASDPESGAQPSQEQLTNSSQVLRPGARQSDLEAAMAAAGVTAGVKGSGADTTSGVGMAGRSSASNTGITATHSSSQGVSGGPSGSIVPSLPDHHRALAQPGGHAAVLPPRGPSQGTDSFNQPPSASGLGHHGPAAYGPAAASASARSSTPSTGPQASSGVTGSASGSGPAAASGGAASASGGGALDQMHAMIAAFGRDFNDKQLVVHGLIGKGGHGTVYRGTWRGLEVAVKSMIFGPDNSTRHQQRPLMEAAISSNLVHPNIVTTYSYELREVQHELASLSPELSQQGGGWRLLIIQEFCDAGPLRRLVDCGFFLTPPKPAPSPAAPAPAPARGKLKLPGMSSLLRKEASSGASAHGDTAVVQAAGTPSRGSSGSSGKARPVESGRTSPGSGCSSGGSKAGAEGGQQAGASNVPSATGDPSTDAAGAQHPAHARPLLEDVPADVGGGRPASSLQAALRYVEAALQIARGLQHIHDKNIVHGDLNPNNVLLVRAPGTSLGFCLKVADFGLSVRMAEDESHLSNLFQGSPYYCAPEVMLSGKIGKSADLYSLGIMLWELQNGTRPPWRMGVRLRTYPSLNTGELDFGPDTPPRYARLARECFSSSKDTRPTVTSVVATLSSIKADLEALSYA